jgi:two-component system osmolarity sensor histidine kinase EnvZ
MFLFRMVPQPEEPPLATRPKGGPGLFWRTFILLGLLILCATLAWLQLFRVQEYEPRILRNAHQIATVVNLTKNALHHSDAITRVALLKILADEEDLQLQTREPDDRIEPFGGSDLENQLARTLIERLGPDTVVASSVNSETGLWVGFRIGRDSYWLLMDPSRLRPLNSRGWMVWLILASGLSLVGAALIAGLINRPLKQLSAAASRVREGRYREIVLDENVSPPEIRELNIGFNRMADRLANIEEERTLMLAGISHDLRTPLARLRLETELSVPDLEARKAMAADIDQLDEIIEKFLGYARPDHTDLSAVLLAPIVSKCVAPLRNNDYMDIELDVPETLQVIADPVELARVIANLLENARRYGQSPSDGISHVMVDAHSRHGKVTVCIRDHGPGVPDEQLAQLTQPFFRGNIARTSAAGSGLGLAIVERAVQRMGGSFSVFNCSDGGLMTVIELQASR